jgi:hypothetical protein
MMSITNSVPSIFQTFSPLLLKSTNFNFRTTHSSKTKSRQVKIATIKELIFFVFLIKDASKNKINQNNNKVKNWKRETSLPEILFLPVNGARKIA